MQFEKQEDEDSGFFLQEKMEEDITVIYEEKVDEDITVISEEKRDEDITVISQEKMDITIISIIKKEPEKSKHDKSTILSKEEEFEVEAILDYEATVSFTLLSHISCQYSRTSLT